MSETLKSPRVTELEERVAAGDSGAVASFWNQAAAEGTPMIEPIEGDDRYALVTFFWRADGQTENVVLLSPWSEETPADNLMERLLETDIFFRTYRARRNVRGSYRFRVNDPLRAWTEMAPEEMQAYFTSFVPDPLNPDCMHWPEFGPYKEEFTSVVTMPDAPPQPWSELQPGVPQGTVEHTRFRSERLGNERDIWIYRPASSPEGLLVVFDGWAYHEPIPTGTILDNLIAAGRIPPLAAVLLENPGQTEAEAQESRNRELPCNRNFADFLATELVPWVQREYGVPANRELTVTAGSSYGGLAATFAGYAHPEVFGRVLSQSGSFWWKPEFDMGNLGAEADEGEEWEWLARQFVAADRLPLRFYLDVGNLENSGPPGAPSQVVVNRHMRNVLLARGYPVHYAEFAGGHDYACWRGTLADGLIALFE
jgi:enterochelin esterase family protein